MRKYILLLLIIPFVFACSSDDEPEEKKQDYTSFVYMQPYIDVEPNVIVAYKTDEGIYKRIAELGDLKKSEYSKEINIKESFIKELYLFSDYPSPSYRLDAVFKLESNKKNVYIPNENTKGIKVTDKTDPTQYPQ